MLSPTLTQSLTRTFKHCGYVSFTLINGLSFTPRPSLRVSVQLCNDPGLCNTHQSWQKVCVCERTFRAHVFQLRASCAAVLWETNKELLLCLWWDGVMRGETGALCVCVWFLGTLLIGWCATAAVGTDCWLAICHQEKCMYWCAPRSWVLSSLRRGETRWEGRSEWERERRINMQMSHGIMTGTRFRAAVCMTSVGGDWEIWCVWDTRVVFAPYTSSHRIW